MDISLSCHAPVGLALLSSASMAWTVLWDQALDVEVLGPLLSGVPGRFPHRFRKWFNIHKMTTYIPDETHHTQPAFKKGPTFNVQLLYATINSKKLCLLLPRAVHLFIRSSLKVPSNSFSGTKFRARIGGAGASAGEDLPSAAMADG